jgi:hypothetical protein
LFLSSNGKYTLAWSHEMPNSFPNSSMIAAVPVVVELSSSDNGSINVSDFTQFGLDS